MSAAETRDETLWPIMSTNQIKMRNESIQQMLMSDECHCEGEGVNGILVYYSQGLHLITKWGTGTKTRANVSVSIVETSVN